MVCALFKIPIQSNVLKLIFIKMEQRYFKITFNWPMLLSYCVVLQGREICAYVATGKNNVCRNGGAYAIKHAEDL